MISGSAGEPGNGIHQQKAISMSPVGRKLDASCEPSPEMVDFLEMCFAKEGADMGKVLKVSGLDLSLDSFLNFSSTLS